MAPLPDVPNVLRARVLFEIGTKPTQGLRTFWRFTGASPTGTDLKTLAEDLYGLLVGVGIATVMSTSVVLTGVTLEDLTSATTPAGEYNTSTPGTRAGVALPADAAFVSSFEIPRRYRGGHPRAYWPFGTDTDLTGPQSWKNASVEAFLAVINNGFTAFVGTTVGGVTIEEQVNVSYYKGFTVITSPTTGRARNLPTPRADPVVTKITSIVGRSYVGSFRKRRLKTS